MRSLRRSAVAGALLVLLGGAGQAEAAPIGSSVPDRSARETATEVCEEMVRAAVEAVVEQPVPGPQAGVWEGRTYTCTYDVGEGNLVLRVDVLRDNGRARSAYGRTRRAAAVEQTFNGLGQQAFQSTDGTLIARKDRFLLTADPSLLPADLTKKDVTFAAVSAVLTCWE